jgi:uncharacterized protein
VDATLLKRALDDTVASCVNHVGVEVNTASRQLLSYVSGLNATIAENLIQYRNLNGPFQTRQQLKNVPRLGEKAFGQAAGFLRIRDAANPLDASAVHPESYPIVTQMARDLNCTVADLVRDTALRARIDLNKYVTATIGLPTLQDILAASPNPAATPPKSWTDSFGRRLKPSDLKVDQTRHRHSITAFGAFVDISVHQDGLVHVSQLPTPCEEPGRNPESRPKVNATVLELDHPEPHRPFPKIPILTPRHQGARRSSNPQPIPSSATSIEEFERVRLAGERPG